MKWPLWVTQLFSPERIPPTVTTLETPTTETAPPLAPPDEHKPGEFDEPDVPGPQPPDPEPVPEPQPPGPPEPEPPAPPAPPETPET